MRSLVPPTPLVEASSLTELVGGEVLLKLESLQRTGSFKVRGAAAKILDLDGAERRAGVVTCSSGNHGKAVAWVAGRLGIPAVVCVPDWVDPVKLEAIRSAGAEARLSGSTYDAAAREAHRLADSEGLAFVHPFDDPVVAAGQGTLALEVLDLRPDVATVVTPLSGGGLAGGVGAALRSRGSDARRVGVSASRARVMFESVRAGRPLELDEEETVASALSGGIEVDNRCTFELVRRHVDAHVVVDEASIVRAMSHALRRLRIVVEGGGAVGIAALLERKVSGTAEGPTVIVVSGGNVSDEVLTSVLHRTRDGGDAGEAGEG